MARAKTLVIAALAVFAFLLVHQASTRAQEKQPPETRASVANSSSPPASASSRYAGSDACKVCHADEYAGRPIQAGLRSVSWRGGQPRRGSQRHLQAFPFREGFGQANQRTLLGVPCVRHGAHARDQFLACSEWRVLHIVSLAAPRQGSAVPARSAPARALLFLPLATEGAVRDAVSSPRE